RVLEYGQARGLQFIVRAYDDAVPLTEIMKRRAKMDPDQVGKIFALACDGLQALHDHQIPGGLLSAGCILLCKVQATAKAQRTVRMLVAAVKKDVFDSTALGGSATSGDLDDLELMPAAGEGAYSLPRPADDVLRLGCLMYRCLAGRAP